MNKFIKENLFSRKPKLLTLMIRFSFNQKRYNMISFYLLNILLVKLSRITVCSLSPPSHDYDAQSTQIIYIT